MTKRRDVLRQISAECKRQDVAFGLLRSKGGHDIYQVGTVRLPVERHNEIPDRLAELMFMQCEPTLGRRWWR